jgi:hypothetical protein
MQLVCVQPASTYYAWQLDVMIKNFIDKGVNPSDMHIVCVGDHWAIDMLKKYPCNFYHYEDTRVSKHYISSIRPNVLKKFIRDNPMDFFYHDCDIIFNKLPDFDKLSKDDIVYGSDTDSYIGESYIKSKGAEVLAAMKNIVGISDTSGFGIGAQYVLKGTDYNFWDDVENDSERLFSEISRLSASKKRDDPSYHELQIWCADMWALLWNLWKRGIETAHSAELDFSWATDSAETFFKKNIYHNAGVHNQKLFKKHNYVNKWPDPNLSFAENTASHHYYELVKKSDFCYIESIKLV